MSCYLCANTCHKDASQLYHTLVNKKADRLLCDLVALYTGCKYQASPLSWVNFPTEQFEKEGLQGSRVTGGGVSTNYQFFVTFIDNTARYTAITGNCVKLS